MTIERVTVYGAGRWPATYTFVPALRVADTVYLSGTTGTEASK